MFSGFPNSNRYILFAMMRTIRKKPITIMTKNPYTKQTSNPHLEPLLAKLRPFQREAYDFCVTGKASSRQYADSSASAPEGEYDPQYLGKGRILLADEMG
jgi:hypothetical protein